ncbi:MAG: hypothetical protein AAGM38_17385 [Pseudomonadota bacterium]
MMRRAAWAIAAPLSLIAGLAAAQSTDQPFDRLLVADALDECAPLTHPWWNPIVGEAAEARVERLAEGPAPGACLYTNRMTATFSVICRFDEPTRRAIAADFRRQHGAEDVKTSMSIRGSEVIATYEINGETYPDTMTISLNNGVCETVSADD